jgi:glyoxylase-like metal-dependent hydrolase (beta-lactamase superfamily II)
MNRRDFLGGTASLALLAGLSCGSVFGQQPAESSSKVPAPGPATPPAPASPGEFHALRRNVGYFTLRGGTIGWLASPDALAAVDTQFADTASAFLAGLPGRARRQLDVVVNTHHHGDHTGGNPVFLRASQQIVAHRRVPLLQMRAAERAGNLHKQAFAKSLFDSAWSASLGDEVLRAFHLGAAHTGGDSIVHFEKANVFHVGDLVFNRMYPVMDRPGGCSVRGWITVLESLMRDCPKDALFIYGHGRPSFGVTGLHEDLGVMRDYLSKLLELVSSEVAAGRSREQVCALENMPGFEDFHVPPGKGNRFASNLAAVYDELTPAPVSTNLGS